MSPKNEHLDAAVRYAEHGWPVFPLTPGSKVPLAKSSGVLEATTDDRQIARWWERHPYRNVAIATGRPGPDVLDVDSKGERSSGYAAWNTVRRAGLVPDPQAIVKTPSGGMHAFYVGTDQRNGALREHGLDFRAQGGYVAAVPSKVDGRSYELIKTARTDAVCQWQPIRDHLEPQPQRPAYQPREGQHHGASHLVGWLEGATEGNRNGSLWWASWRAAQAGDNETIAALADVGRRLGLDDREIGRTIDSARKIAGNPRSGSPKVTDREAV